MSSELSNFFQSLSIQEGELEPWVDNLSPTFPMQERPLCRRCGYKPKYRNTVLPHNPNGNAGRPYYVCIKCKNDRKRKVSKTDHEKGWISWDDDRGVRPSNHHCGCRIVCRQDRAGKDSSCPGRGFWTCAIGSCGYVSFRRDGLTDDEAKDTEAAPDAGFEPWLF